MQDKLTYGGRPTAPYSIPTNGARDFEAFSINKTQFLGVANWQSNSELYTLGESGHFELNQTLETSEAHDLAFHSYHSMHFLAVATHHRGNSFSIDSRVYSYQDGTFRFFDDIPTKGAYDVEFFEIGTQLAVANEFDGSTHTLNSEVCVLQDGQFALHQSIVTQGAMDFEHFLMSGTHYLAD